MFDVFLQELIDAVPGARGAVFCDPEGETVTAIGATGRSDRDQVNDFDLRVLGAQFATPVYLTQRAAEPTWGALRECVVTGKNELLLLHMLPQRYFLILCLEPQALRARGMQQLRSMAARIAAEM
jgi:predicted regulator of Ras-like GTPase activity (Roadblock/LC7/MglB family)